MKSNYPTTFFMFQFAWLLKDMTEALSGAYKFSKAEQFVEGGGTRPLTDEEKLKNLMGKMRNRLTAMEECMEKHFPSDEG